jgi:DNA-binding transcriptional MerR regulator
MVGVTTSDIPNRSLFRQPEVCDIAQVQPYVLRSWEAEFPDLGVSKTAGGPRVYRRADLERVLRLKHLLFVEGLTLAGARKRLLEERPPVETEAPGLDELLGSDARERILEVKQGLREIAAMLATGPGNGHGAVKTARRTVGRSVRSASTPPTRAAAAKHGKGGTKPLFDLAERPARVKKAAGKKRK